MLTTFQANALGALLVADALYLALCDGDPSVTGDENEITGGGYARVLLVLDQASVSGGEEVFNSDPVIFAEGSADLGSITHWSIFDAATDGNSVMRGAFASPVKWNDGTIFTVPAEELKIVIPTV